MTEAEFRARWEAFCHDTGRSAHKVSVTRGDSQKVPRVLFFCFQIAKKVDRTPHHHNGIYSGDRNWNDKVYLSSVKFVYFFELVKPTKSTDREFAQGKGDDPGGRPSPLFWQPYHYMDETFSNFKAFDGNLTLNSTLSFSIFFNEREEQGIKEGESMSVSHVDEEDLSDLEDFSRIMVSLSDKQCILFVIGQVFR